MDEIDQAQEYERLHREIALREHYRRRDKFLVSEHRNPGLHPTGAGPGERRLCQDCGEEIGAGRLAAVTTATRCIDCQEKAERKGLK